MMEKMEKGPLNSKKNMEKRIIKVYLLQASSNLEPLCTVRECPEGSEESIIGIQLTKHQVEQVNQSVCSTYLTAILQL